jgi:tetratricopeptide (TPR) repeat protein
VNATTSDESPQARQADDAPEEETTEFASAAQEQLIKSWPTLDKGDALSRARRWPLWVLILALVGGGSLFATRIHATRSRAAASSRSAAQVAIAPTAKVPPASEGGQGVAFQAGAQTVDQMAGLQPTAEREKQVAAPADAETKPEHTAEQGPGSQAQPAPGETPSRPTDGEQTHPPTMAVVPPATEELGERCRRADARGKGRPAAVMAACRPAIEAEPEAADIMVILARVQLDLGRPGEARSWAKKALQGKRALPDAYVFLGGAEQEMGRPAEAKAAYRKYLELAPTGSHARDLRAVVDRL